MIMQIDGGMIMQSHMLIFRPDDLVVGRTVLVTVALALIVLSLPSRKGLAIAFNYYIDLNSHHVHTED